MEKKKHTHTHIKSEKMKINKLKIFKSAKVMK
jgi:hypothetical protein